MPIQTFDANGNLIFNSDTMGNGLCLGTLTVPSGGSLVKTYPSLNGATIRVLGLDGTDTSFAVSVTYPSGVPTITAQSYAGYVRYLSVWLISNPSVIPTSGMYAQTTTGSVSLVPEAHGLNFIGRATHVRTVPTVRDVYGTGTIGYSEFYIDSPHPPACGVEISSSNEWFLMREVSPHASIQGRWVITAIRAANPGVGLPDVSTPVVYCFARKNTVHDTQAKLYDSDGNVSWNLCEPGLLYPAKTLQSALYHDEAVPALTKPVVFGTPLYWGSESEQIGNFGDLSSVISNFQGAWRMPNSTTLRQGRVHVYGEFVDAAPGPPTGINSVCDVMLIEGANF